MPYGDPLAPQRPAGRRHRGTVRGNRRAWRLRSRRAQVSAVAVIFALLIVVVFIGDYLSTTLPNTMGQNDLQHEVQVENQVAELSALLQVTAQANVIGVQVSQPVSLGSQGAPPFAHQDEGSLTPLSIVGPQAGNFPESVVNFSVSGPAGILRISPASVAGFVVHLINTYAPSAEVAFDQGAVVFAQPGGLPILVLNPRISFASGVLSLFVPRFTNAVPGEAGVGTADLSFRLISTTRLTLPTAIYTFPSGSKINITVVTQYAAAWYAYFQSVSSLSAYVTCSGANSVCTALYTTGASLGTVKLSIPTTGLTLKLLTAWYSVSVS